jgi:methylenetetrahydrofolate--tRNA-(uracil-5-)-methyltransferase
MIHIIGGGLAGSEAAWQAASLGVPVTIHEMRPVRPTAVHKTDRLAELVCSNSFRGDKLDNAVGLLKEEMRRLGSLVMRAADPTPFRRIRSSPSRARRLRGFLPIRPCFR